MYENFIEDYADQIHKNRAGLFIGAGISAGSGSVDWKTLMLPLAKEIGLDIEREKDLPRLAEYYQQAKKNRNILISRITEGLKVSSGPNAYHEIITALPLQEIWTSNFDQLLEQAYSDRGKRTLVRTVDESFAAPQPESDVTIYKIHGDIGRPNDIVITESDYKKYDNKYHLMATKLEAELSEKTFLFLGFSLEDPNFRSIIARNEVRLGENVHRHYAVVKQPEEPYELRKFEFFEHTANALGIQIVRVADFDQVLQLLLKIRSACPEREQIISGYDVRNRFIVRKLGDLVLRKQAATIYITAVFSAFAISDDEEYAKGEPVQTNEHMSLILKEKEYLERLLEMEGSHFHVLLCPPQIYEAKNAIRYRNILTWLKRNGHRKNLAVRCAALNYYSNLLLVDGEFCVVGTYSESVGYYENRVYFDRASLEHQKNVFRGRFNNPAIAPDIDMAIAFYEGLLDRAEWDTKSTREVYKWRDFTLIEAHVNVGTKEIVYAYVDHPGSIIIVPVTTPGTVVLVEQYRYLLDKLSIEFPGGAVEEGEDFKTACERELVEETGYRPGRSELIGSFYTSNAITNEFVQVVLATDLAFVGKTPGSEEVEETTRVELSLAAVSEKIARGEITDGPTICAMQMLTAHLRRSDGEQ